jgi:hypothetical protein
LNDLHERNAYRAESSGGKNRQCSQVKNYNWQRSWQTRVILEKLVISLLVKKLPDFYVNRMFIIVFIKARQWVIS